jgi:hypothetical protein
MRSALVAVALLGLVGPWYGRCGGAPAPQKPAKPCEQIIFELRVVQRKPAGGRTVLANPHLVATVGQTAACCCSGSYWCLALALTPARVTGQRVEVTAYAECIVRDSTDNDRVKILSKLQWTKFIRFRRTFALEVETENGPCVVEIRPKAVRR